MAVILSVKEKTPLVGCSWFCGVGELAVALVAAGVVTVLEARTDETNTTSITSTDTTICSVHDVNNLSITIPTPVTPRRTITI